MSKKVQVKSNRNDLALGLVVLMLVIAGIGAALAMTGYWLIWGWLVISYIIAMTLFAAALFVRDKAMAAEAGWRIKEATLLTALWTCGVVGAWGAMCIARHKTRKFTFQIWAVPLTILNPLWAAIFVLVRYW